MDTKAVGSIKKTLLYNGCKTCCRRSAAKQLATGLLGHRNHRGHHKHCMPMSKHQIGRRGPCSSSLCASWIEARQIQVQACSLALLLVLLVWLASHDHNAWPSILGDASLQMPRRLSLQKRCSAVLGVQILSAVVTSYQELISPWISRAAVSLPSLFHSLSSVTTFIAMMLLLRL